MAAIKLNGKHSVGDHAYALVDDDDYERVAMFAWKAKPNGNGTHVYAVRTEKGADGVTRDIRMHRFVLGYDGDQDVDHINRIPLDNRKQNLRVATRSENQLNRGRWLNAAVCRDCGIAYAKPNKANFIKPDARCNLCAKKAAMATARPRRKEQKRRARARRGITALPMALPTCEHCGVSMHQKRPGTRFCSAVCKKKARYARQKTMGKLPPSAALAADRAKAWRASKRRAAAHG
jgi:hypothetical protein